MYRIQLRDNYEEKDRFSVGEEAVQIECFDDLVVYTDFQGSLMAFSVDNKMRVMLDKDVYTYLLVKYKSKVKKKSQTFHVVKCFLICLIFPGCLVGVLRERL